MSRVGAFSLADKFKGEMNGVDYNIEREVFLTPDNRIPWGDLAEVDGSGNPVGATLGQPGFPDGFNIYAAIGSPGNMVRQNESPLPWWSRYVFFLTSIATEGHAPPSEAEAGITFKAPAPLLLELPLGFSGFQEGAYRLAFTGIDDGGRHTLLSPPTAAAVAAGYWITFSLPELAQTYAGLGIWLSYKNFTSPLFLQEVLDLREAVGVSHTLRGPFQARRLQPTQNETFLGRAYPPSWSIAGSGHDLLAGTHKLYATLRTRSGESLAAASPTSVPVPYDLVRSTLSVYPAAKPAGLIGWHLYAELADGRTYAVYPTGSNPETPLLTEQKAEVYSTNPGGWSGTGWEVAQKDLPLTDQSGLPALDVAPYDITLAAPSNPMSIGTTVYCQLALTQGNREGPRGPLASLSIAGINAMILGVAPKTTQLLQNPQGLETDANGLPLTYEVRQTPTVNGTVVALGGELFVATSGTATSEAASFAVRPTSFDKTLTHTVVCQFEVSNWLSGKAQLVLLEYASANPTYGSTAPSRTTVIQEVASDGARDVSFAIPPSFWLAGTLSYRMVARITDAAGVVGAGAQRNLTLTVRHLAVFPHEHTPRKWVDPFLGEATPSDPDVPATTPFPIGPVARVGPPPASLVSPLGEAWNFVDRPLQDGVVEQELTFEGGTIDSSWTQVKKLGSANAPTDPNLTLAVNATAAIVGTRGVQLRDQTITQASTLGIEQVLTTGFRHRAGVGARVRVVTPGAGGRRDLLEIAASSGTAICAISQDAARHFHLWYQSAGAWFSRRLTLLPVANNTPADLDLTVSGAGTDKGVVSAWAVFAATGTRQLLARFEKLDLRGLLAQKVFAGVREYVASDTHETHIDNVRVTDGGQRWYRDHNADGLLLNQAHLFMPLDASVTQGAFIGDVRIAVKPGQRYGLAAFFRATGVVGTAYPLSVTLHRLNGEQIPLGSLINAGAGVSGTSPWKEHLVEVQVPDYDPDDPSQNVYEMTIDSRDTRTGTYVLQELAMTELAPADALLVKRTGKRRTTGTYRATLDTETPRRGRIAPRLPRTWVRAVLDLSAAPPTTSFAYRLRSTNDRLTYGAYHDSLADVTRRRYLETEATFVGDGVQTPVLAPSSPALEMRLTDATLLKEDGSELPGGVLVTGFSFPYRDPVYEIAEQADRRNYRQQLAEDVPWLDGFSCQIFNKDALQYLRNRWAKELFLVENEASGDAATVKILEKPEWEVRTDLVYIDSLGQFYNTYAVAEIGECEVVAITAPPGM